MPPKSSSISPDVLKTYRLLPQQPLSVTATTAPSADNCGNANGPPLFGLSMSAAAPAVTSTTTSDSAESSLFLPTYATVPPSAEMATPAPPTAATVDDGAAGSGSTLTVPLGQLAR